MRAKRCGKVAKRDCASCCPTNAKESRLDAIGCAPSGIAAMPRQEFDRRIPEQLDALASMLKGCGSREAAALRKEHGCMDRRQNPVATAWPPFARQELLDVIGHRIHTAAPDRMVRPWQLRHSRTRHRCGDTSAGL